MLSRRGLSAILCLVGLACVVSLPTTARAAGTVRINGSGIGLDMMKPLINAYAKAHPEVRIEMEKPLGTSGAMKALIAGALDIVVSSKPLKPEEAAKGVLLRDYGTTPMAIVTEKGVPKDNVTSKELEEIFSGKSTKWPDERLIKVVLRPEHDVDTMILRKLSPSMNAAMTAAHAREGMLIAITDPESNETIAKTPGAIGATGLPGVLVGGEPLKVLALNGVKPTPAALANGSYPMQKAIRFATLKNCSSASLKLLDFIYSPRGRAIAEKTGVRVTATGKGGK